MKNRFLIRLLILQISILWGGFSMQVAAEDMVFGCVEHKPYVDKHARNMGLASDIMVEVMLRAGYIAEPRIMSWNRVLKQAKQGDIDGSFCAARTKEREQWFAYVKTPILVKEYVLFKLKSNPAIVDRLTDFSQFTGTELRGGVGADYLGKLGMKDVILVSREVLKYRILGAHRVDFVGADRLIGWTTIKEHLPNMLDDIEVAGPILRQSPEYIAISRARHANAEKIAARIDLAFQEITNNGTLNSIYLRHNMPQ